MARTALILIVDDDVDIRRLFESILKPEGYRIASAESGAEAIASIAHEAPDLVLLDVEMPGMDGNQVARILKSDRDTASIPIIMVTARTDHDARMAGLKAGAEDFVAKPLDRGELLLRVRNMLRLKFMGDRLKDHANRLEAQVRQRTAELHRFRAAMEISGDGISLVDRASMRYIDVNQTLCDLLGYTREHIIGKTPMELFGIGRPDLEAAYDAIIAAPSGTPTKLDGHVRHRDGALIPFEARESALSTDDGWIIVASTRDVSERKKA